MNPTPRIHIILPAFNEEKSLPNLLDRFADLELSAHCHVWVVNDGSTDATASIADQAFKDLHITMVEHRINLGLGQALQTGIQSVLEFASDKDIVVVMDADDTHDVLLIEGMLQHIQSGSDIVIASRFVYGGNDQTAPSFRRLLSRGASFVFNLFLPLNGIRDFTSGYRAYRCSLLKRAVDHWGERLIEERGFACMVELLLKLRYWEPVIKEMPFVLRYDRKLGASKLKLTRTILQYLKLAIRDRLSPPPVMVKMAKA